jgi:hypothetical protein
MANGHRGLLILTLAAGAAAAGTGCSAQRAEPVRLLRTEDFVAPSAASMKAASDQAPEGVDQTPLVQEDQSAGTAAPQVAFRNEPELLDIGLSVGPAVPEAAALAAERPVLIDAKVGEINGRPIRAQEIFDDIGARLAAGRRQPNMSRAQWMEESTRLIREWLELALIDELLQAEARASLRPEQQMGLRHMVQDWSENVRRESGGSRAAAERQAQEQNKTIRQMERERESMILIGYQLDERIRKRVRVSWKDVRLYYERNAEAYNPPARARYRIIRVPRANAQALARVQQMLDSGTPFATVAAAPENTFRREEGGLRTPDILFTGEYASAAIDLAPQLADAARKLAPGQWTVQPVQQGDHATWIFLEQIVRESRPLSDRDVQLEIAARLNRTAVDTERRAYIERLKERASFTDLDEMARRLAEIAAERYWPRS